MEHCMRCGLGERLVQVTPDGKAWGCLRQLSILPMLNLVPPVPVLRCPFTTIRSLSVLGHQGTCRHQGVLVYPHPSISNYQRCHSNA